MDSKTTSTLRPAKLIAIGAGNRMRTYMHYVLEHPERATIEAVVEPDAIRLNAMADVFKLPENRRFQDYKAFFQNPVPADAVIICTPENVHFEPTMLAIKKGYHVLLEKPIAQTFEECKLIAEAAREEHRIVGICHVLRFFPFYLKIKELIDYGDLGKIMTINHTESVGIDRDTHSYVRGTMNREKGNNPMLLAKCCHDMDFLLWISGQKCHAITSFGSLRWFRKENAPEGSTARCIDCKVEKDCPYSAVNLYWRRREWIKNFNVPPGTTIEDSIQKELHTGRFGRCVYRCDNDVVDNQSVLMQMQDKTLITLSMETFTQHDYRSTYIHMTGGEISCDEKSVIVNHFLDHRIEEYDFSSMLNQPYHGGADLKIIEQFIEAIQGHPEAMPTLIESSLESHRLCFEGERSRVLGQTVYLD